MADATTKEEPKQPQKWWQELVNNVAALAAICLLIIVCSYSCTHFSNYRTDYQISAEQAARVTAAACMKDGRLSRFQCIETCRQSPNQVACIDEVNAIAPMWQPAPGARQ